MSAPLMWAMQYKMCIYLTALSLHRPFWSKPKPNSVGTIRAWIYQRSQPPLAWTVSKLFSRLKLCLLPLNQYRCLCTSLAECTIVLLPFTCFYAQFQFMQETLQWKISEKRLTAPHRFLTPTHESRFNIVFHCVMSDWRSFNHLILVLRDVKSNAFHARSSSSVVLFIYSWWTER